MTEKEQRALRVSAMLLEAETLAMESKRLGQKMVDRGILEPEEILSDDDLADRADFLSAVRFA